MVEGTGQDGFSLNIALLPSTSLPPTHVETGRQGNGNSLLLLAFAHSCAHLLLSPFQCHSLSACACGTRDLGRDMECVCGMWRTWKAVWRDRRGTGGAETLFAAALLSLSLLLLLLIYPTVCLPTHLSLIPIAGHKHSSQTGREGGSRGNNREGRKERKVRLGRLDSRPALPPPCPFCSLPAQGSAQEKNFALPSSP